MTADPSLGIGSTQVSPKAEMVMIYVLAGEFQMGSNDGYDDEKPVHTVYLDAYWINQTEVINTQYTRCVAEGACKVPASSSSYARASYYGNSQFDNYPVIYVDWTRASAYCTWAGRRLPSEAEWERAALGTDGSIYRWGSETPNPQLLNHNQNTMDTSAVGSYLADASPYGALDIAGNVLEWIADWQGTYPSESFSNPTGPASCDFRVLRGGLWYSY
jgi:serine/threonine-protein kinase